MECMFWRILRAGGGCPVITTQRQSIGDSSPGALGSILIDCSPLACLYLYLKTSNMSSENVN